MASRCIGAWHLAFLRSGPAAGRAALAPIHAAGAASLPPSTPAAVSGSRSAGSARSCSAGCEDAAFSAARILRSRDALALLSGAGAPALTGSRQIAAIFSERTGDRAAVCRGVCFARMGRGEAPGGRHATASSTAAPLPSLCCALLAELRCHRRLGAPSSRRPHTRARRVGNCVQLPQLARTRESSGALAGCGCHPQRRPLPGRRWFAIDSKRAAYCCGPRAADAALFADLLLLMMVPPA
jgi:hypothetical protein